MMKLNQWTSLKLLTLGMLASTAVDSDAVAVIRHSPGNTHGLNPPSQRTAPARPAARSGNAIPFHQALLGNQHQRVTQPVRATTQPLSEEEQVELATAMSLSEQQLEANDWGNKLPYEDALTIAIAMSQPEGQPRAEEDLSNLGAAGGGELAHIQNNFSDEDEDALAIAMSLEQPQAEEKDLIIFSDSSDDEENGEQKQARPAVASAQTTRTQQIKAGAAAAARFDAAQAKHQRQLQGLNQMRMNHTSRWDHTPAQPLSRKPSTSDSEDDMGFGLFE